MPGKRNYSSYTQQEDNTRTRKPTYNSITKKLRRLPHVFGKVLELPFKSDEDVYVEDRHDCLKFVASNDSGVVEGGIHVVEMHPGITKVVVRNRGVCVDDLELDVWRFRLPVSVRPELVTVVYPPGLLVVTVPKN
ncbi:hypothetical protein RND81_05G150100 [Saponaria officinalis]|uniref:SHSP domain-containing protein n=1 Tax=Saponaria officinalis TaxID=3572 RepID=A0AAW1KXB9_SAPOF